MTVRGSRRFGEGVTTLLQANAVGPMTPPAGATAQEKCDFYQKRADMFRSVAETDKDHYWEAMACAGLEQEKADRIRDMIRQSKVINQQ